jgi:1-acyl-sn-glycerol-3-phosphate acyltransferase
VSGRRVPDPHAAPVSSRPAPSPSKVGARQLVSDDDGDGIDRWGRSARTRTVVRTLMEPAYRHWFRFALEGLEHIPRHGGALLVANHAGAVPVDAMLLMHGIERERDRAVYGLHHHALAAVPVFGTLLARAGGVVAHPENALRLLRDDGQLVLVFPEGTKGTTKLYRDRYRLARFGRGGFVETAMRAGVPVVPIAVVGSEETMPTVSRVPIGAGQSWPITVNALLFGPIGTVVHFPVAITAHVLPPVVFDEPPGLEEYPTFRVADATEMIRSKIQTALDDIVSRPHHGGRR